MTADLESRLRSEQDSQALMEERDYLVNLILWYRSSHQSTEQALGEMLARYNELVKRHVQERDAKPEEVKPDGDSTPTT